MGRIVSLLGTVAGDHLQLTGPKANAARLLSSSFEPSGKAKSMKSSRRPWSEVTAIEYALIASLIAVFIVATFQTVGVHAGAIF